MLLWISKSSFDFDSDAFEVENKFKVFMPCIVGENGVFFS